MTSVNNTTTTNVLRSYAKQATPEQRAKMKEKISELIGEVFFSTILKQARSQADLSNPLNGGRAGQTFQAQLDQTLMQKWASSKQFGVGRKIADKWMGV